MYLRYIVSYHNSLSGKPETGIFRAADHVRDHTGIDAQTKARLQLLIEWFDEHLPVPDFYDDAAKRRADDHTYFWFKRSAENFIEKIERCAIFWKLTMWPSKRLSADKLPGKLIFQDECQIAVNSPENSIYMK
jgi:hypothetical protein